MGPTHALNSICSVYHQVGDKLVIISRHTHQLNVCCTLAVVVQVAILEMHWMHERNILEQMPRSFYNLTHLEVNSTGTLPSHAHVRMIKEYDQDFRSSTVTTPFTHFVYIMHNSAWSFPGCRVHLAHHLQAHAAQAKHAPKVHGCKWTDQA
jgi:hypothetical protein